MDNPDSFLEKELKKMMAANGGMAAAVEDFHSKANAQKGKQMVNLIIRSLYNPGQDDFRDWEKGAINNHILLEILRNLKSAGCEVEKPLLDYSSRIHKLSGVRDGKGNLRETAKQHLLDVGLAIVECKRRSYQPKKIPPTHWRNL